MTFLSYSDHNFLLVKNQVMRPPPLETCGVLADNSALFSCLLTPQSFLGLCSMSAMKSQEASSSASPCSYHVFLSFRGEDTRKTFTYHLYTALNQAGFCTFRDGDGLEKGEDIKCELEKAIRESRISIIIFSKNYASSTWCLEELVMILKCKTLGHVVLLVFYDVDPSEVKKQLGSLEEAFTRQEEKLKSETSELAKEKLKDKVETWRVALREVADVAGMNLQNQVDG
ncbi:TMV resistance protein N-like [Rhododendron vialii]|uniref:TMV resistance protein N-like n=1 Tax=Rhododendron vialii TaxID=182163 RepID=UPI00265E1C1A|nr:TMV resistance protein N-like [Rhododendron vialii]